MPLKPNAYSQPPPFTWVKIEPRDVLPIFPPPEPLDRPSLPSPPRKPIFDAPYTLSTHIFPAAYLRSTRLAPIPPLPPPNASKEERTRTLATVQKHLKDIRTAQNTDGYPRVLWNCANRYVKNDLNDSNRTGITLFVAHANGFPKEIWEPTLGYLLSSPAASFIDEVWSWEAVQHGDAGLINALSASALFDWRDNSRDIVNFLVNYIPKETTSKPLPVHLSRLANEETELRLKSGFSDRKFVVIGHSLGGGTCTLAAYMFPKLFTSLILVDPVITRPLESAQVENTVVLAAGSLNRREVWSSREEAYESFLKNPFFRTWDPASLKVYVDCGIYLTSDPDTKKQIARLKMSGLQETTVFLDTDTAFEVYDRVPGIDENIPIRWIFPGKPGASEIGGEGASKYRAWLRPKNSTNTRILGGGHLIPQEAPRELAEDLQEYLLHLFSPTHQASFKANL